MSTKKVPSKKTPRTKVAKQAIKKVTKKATKKTSTKAAKKNIKKTGTTSKPRVLVCAADQECFWTQDGEILNSLVALRDAFGRMSDDVYGYHVSKGKNDFADWVDAVLEDAACASEIRKSRKPKTAKTIVVRHLRSYDF